MSVSSISVGTDRLPWVVWRDAGWPAEGWGVQVMALVSGRLEVRIPELGLRLLGPGEWCLLSDLGATSAVKEEGRMAGFRAEIPLREFSGEEGIWWTVPAKLACLGCLRRDSAFFVKGACCGRLAQLAEALSESAGSTLAAEWMRRSRLAEFVARVLERPELQAVPACRVVGGARDRALIEKVARHLEAHLDEAHTLAGLARRCFLNECKLKQGFKEHYGETVFGYLRRKRMERAWTLLQATEATVLEVANAVGYSNPSHFARAFREVHAINPGEVRRVSGG